MTDNEISKYRGKQNSYFAELLNDPNTTGTYIDKSTWKEDLLNNEYQYEEYQEEEYNNENYSNFIEERSSMEAIYDLINGSDYSNVSIKIDCPYHGSITKYFYVLSKEVDIINNLYLEVDLGENFEEISIEEKYSILNSEIEFKFSLTQFDKLQLITCIINQICAGNNIKEDNNVIQIPLYNFDTCIDKKSNIKGFPNVVLKDQQMSIKLTINNKIKHFNYKLIVNGLVYQNKERIHLYMYNFKYIFLQNQHRFSQKLNNKYKLYFNHIVKYIMIYFMSNKDINFWEMTENYPLINKASLFIDNKESLVFENEDLLDFEIFGIKVYMLPLCKEFSNFENIYETFKNPLKLLSSSGINFSYIFKESTYINVDIENKSEMYNINIIGVNFNFITIENGSCCSVYYNNSYININN